MYDILELNKKLLAELRDIAKGLKIKRVESFKKQDLIYKILDTQAIVVSETKSSRKEGPGRDSGSRDQKPQTPEDAASKAKRRPGRPKKTKKPETESQSDSAQKPVEKPAGMRGPAEHEYRETPAQEEG